MLRLKAERRSLAKVSGASAPESRTTKTTDIAYCSTQSPGSNPVVSLSREIPLTNGLVAIVDECDYEMLSHWSWQVGSHGYALRNIRRNRRTTSVLMHRMILLPDPNQYVDHRNADKLDNRRRNLRICTMSQNMGNQRLSVKNKSGFKGVSPNHRDGNWQACIGLSGQSMFLGLFDDPADAARAYDRAARFHFGPFARLNFPTVAP